MSIELELRLKGEDVNEDALLDLINWLQQTNIDGLEVKRKELPPDEGDMGLVPDFDTIITILQTIDDFKLLIDYLSTWVQLKKIMICPKLQNIAEELQDNYPNILAMVQEIQEKFCQDEE